MIGVRFRRREVTLHMVLNAVRSMIRHGGAPGTTAGLTVDTTASCRPFQDTRVIVLSMRSGGQALA